MPEHISPIELEERLSLMADGIYRQLILLSKKDKLGNKERYEKTRSLAVSAKNKILLGISTLPASDNYDELHELYIQTKYIQRNIVRKATPDTLNRKYISDWIDE